MDKHFVLSKIKDYEAHLDNVAPLMESDDQLIMNELRQSRTKKEQQKG